MAKYYWIIEFNVDPKCFQWRESATSRGGLDMRAYRSRREAKGDLYIVRQMQGHARLVKFVRAGSTNREKDNG